MYKKFVLSLLMISILLRTVLAGTLWDSTSYDWDIKKADGTDYYIAVNPETNAISKVANTQTLVNNAYAHLDWEGENLDWGVSEIEISGTITTKGDASAYWIAISFYDGSKVNTANTPAAYPFAFFHGNNGSVNLAPTGLSSNMSIQTSKTISGLKQTESGNTFNFSFTYKTKLTEENERYITADLLFTDLNGVELGKISSVELEKDNSGNYVYGDDNKFSNLVVTFNSGGTMTGDYATSIDSLKVIHTGAIPETSTCAAIFGVLTFFVAFARRKYSQGANNISIIVKQQT